MDSDTAPIALTVRLPNADFFLVPDEVGCKRPDHCRLACVRQARALRRVIEGISSSCGVPSGALLKGAPRVPVKSIFSRYVDGVAYWTNLNAFVKKLSSMSPSHTRFLFPVSRRGSIGSQARQSLSFSLSLLGKSLHPPCSCHAHYTNKHLSHRESISRPEKAELAYVGFCRDMARRMFRNNWDRGYSAACASSVPSTNGCFERGRRRFGAASLFNDQTSFLNRVLGSEDVPFDSIGRYSEVCSAGKIRPLTIMHSSFEHLRPLHKTLYNYISRQPWLLRGPPLPERFVFSSDEGEFVSVDFESATDNLSVRVAEVILESVFEGCRSVPLSIQNCAFQALRPVVEYDPLETLFGKLGLGSGSPRLSSGQMMGSLLSFPLLCLQTFFFYLWSTDQTDLTGRQLRTFDRCLINGDDLVFKTKDSKKFFHDASLTLSKINQKKTQVSSVYFNINSTLFSFKRGVVRSVPFLRPAQFDISLPVNVGRSVFEATRWLSTRTDLQRRSFDWLMREASAVVRKFGWSFESCGFKGPKQADWLRRNGMMGYECDVRSLNQSFVVPEEKPFHATTMVPSPFEYSQTFLREMSGLYNSWWRFTTKFPAEKERFFLDEECEKRRFDLQSSLKERDLRSRKAKRLAKKALGSMLGSFYPFFYRDLLFTSRKKHRAWAFGCLAQNYEKTEKFLLPKPLADFLQDPVALICDGGSRAHPYFLQRVGEVIKAEKKRNKDGCEGAFVEW
uniref:RNA-dependent RNA polymerase n=1 Tax=Tonghua Botou tick virus 1 TaxID=2972042 RepID=A0A9E7V204_9VIRU|nr:MAG: RNA-dependent RNA polymerase [Tonghua Botou tick virus 1]